MESRANYCFTFPQVKYDFFCLDFQTDFRAGVAIRFPIILYGKKVLLIGELEIRTYPPIQESHVHQDANGCTKIILDTR